MPQLFRRLLSFLSMIEKTQLHKMVDLKCLANWKWVPSPTKITNYNANNLKRGMSHCFNFYYLYDTFLVYPWFKSNYAWAKGTHIHTQLLEGFIDLRYLYVCYDVNGIKMINNFDKGSFRMHGGTSMRFSLVLMMETLKTN